MTIVFDASKKSEMSIPTMLFSFLKHSIKMLESSFNYTKLIFL